MTDTATPSGIINSDLFIQYTGAWLAAVNSSDSSPLASSFLTPTNERLLYVSFPIQQIVGLVSAVGVSSIKMRFLLVPDGNGNQHFSVALFATDAQGVGERLSAYYVPDQYWTADTPSPELGEQVPNGLAAIWMANWKGVSEINSALFTTSYGPLEGYNFDIKDFVSLLFGTQALTQEFRIGLSLHEYYSATGDAGQLTQTFGVVTYLYDTTESSNKAVASQFYDMSAPCPPNT